MLGNQLSKNKIKQKSPDLHWSVAFDNSHNTNTPPMIEFNGFSSSHVWMWELDYKESWVLKNWCFWTVVLEKTLESPLDGKEIKPLHPNGDQSWVFIGRTVVYAETPILWPPDAKNWLIFQGMKESQWCATALILAQETWLLTFQEFESDDFTLVVVVQFCFCKSVFTWFALFY